MKGLGGKNRRAPAIFDVIENLESDSTALNQTRRYFF